MKISHVDAYLTPRCSAPSRYPKKLLHQSLSLQWLCIPWLFIFYGSRNYIAELSKSLNNKENRSVEYFIFGRF